MQSCKPFWTSNLMVYLSSNRVNLIHLYMARKKALKLRSGANLQLNCSIKRSKVKPQSKTKASQSLRWYQSCLIGRYSIQQIFLKQRTQKTNKSKVSNSRTRWFPIESKILTRSSSKHSKRIRLALSSDRNCCHHRSQKFVLKLKTKQSHGSQFTF